jgi:Dolichyl-phosphate-mannose-protein mannosyltransferase
LILFLVVALQAAFFVVALITDGDAEGVYLYHGWLAVTGQISLYQDEMTGHRVPLPYYVFGVSQVLFGPSLVAARAVSAALGLGSLVFVWRLATRLGGETCGVLAALFATTQAYLLGYFAWATFHSLISFLLLTGLYVLLATEHRLKRVWAMAISTLLFFTRPQVWPLHAVALPFLVWNARSRVERWIIVAVGLGPPLMFFLWSTDHLKLFASVPLLRRLVLPLGFQAVEVPYRYEHDWRSAIGGASMLLVRSYKAWLVAVAVLAMAASWAHLQGRRAAVRRFVANRGVNIVAIVACYLAAWQLLIIRFSLKTAVGYFPSFAILAAIPIGYGFSVVLEDRGATPALRRIVIGVLMILFVAGPSASPPPALPLAVALDRLPAVQLQDVARRLCVLIPPGSRVFLFGPSETLHMARLKPYLQQANHLETLSPMSNDWSRRRSGLWGATEIREWLSRDAGYAVVRLDVLREARPNQNTPLGNNVDLIESLLARYFALRAVIDMPNGPPLYVYQRVTLANSNDGPLHDV